MHVAMIVENDATLAAVTARNLEQDIPGVKVLTVSSWKQASSIMNDLTPSALIAGLSAEEGSGSDLVKELTTRTPDMATIWISDGPAAESVCMGKAEVLVTPYEAEDLAVLVSRALERDREGVEASLLDPGARCHGYDGYQVRNLLGDLLLGLRILDKEVKEHVDDPTGVQGLINHRVEDLCGTVREIAGLLPPCSQGELRPGKSHEGFRLKARDFVTFSPS